MKFRSNVLNMLRLRSTLLFFSMLTLCSQLAMSQTLVELAVPKYMGSKTAASVNNARTPFGVCLRIDGLTPNTAYDVRGGIGLVSDAPTSFGAGNMWTGAAYSGNVLNNAFITDASGSSGPFWLFFQPTGNGTRFDGGQIHNLRIGYAVNGSSMPSTPAFVGTKTITALDIAITPRTAATTDDGAFVKGSAMPSSGGKYVLLYDNTTGTGDPLFLYQIRQAVPTQTFSQTDLPTEINDVYMQAGTSAIGDYPAVIPIGTNNPAGVRRIEGRNADFTIYAFNTDADGIWPSGANTTTVLRREVVLITNTDAPLVPVGPTIPTILTDSVVTNITHTSAVSGGEVTSDGNSLITARGLCWSTSSNPTILDPHTTEPGTTGHFFSTMTGLNASTIYHYRAYATNSVGTSYGNDYQFTTLCDPVAPVSNFWADVTEIMVGEAVNFFDSTIYCPETWNWSFVGGNPMTSNLQNPTGIVYDYPGEYTVCLTTTNASGTHTLCKEGYIHVLAPLNAQVVITEISYNPPESGNDSLEFIELYNNDVSPVNLEEFYFSAGVTFTFPDYELGAGEYVVVGVNDTVLINTFGIPALEWTSGALSNNGEPIVLRDRYDAVVDSVSYDDIAPWDSLADGYGHSLELCDPNSNNALGENWSASLTFQGVNTAFDTIWASPMEGCLEPPVAGFFADDTTIIVGGTVLFSSTSAGTISNYSWTFEGGMPDTYDGPEPPPVEYDNTGIYDVTLTVGNAAGSHTLIRQDYIEVGPSAVNDQDADACSVYPNPSMNGSFRLSFDSEDVREIAVLTELGREILRTSSSGKNVGITLPNPSPGIYIVKITGNNHPKVTYQKLIIH